MPDYRKIKLVVLDVDGTLTDGGICYDSQGTEIKRFDVKDGLGIKVGMAAGLEFAILTGRVSPMVDRRVKELGIQHLLTGVQMKLPALKRLVTDLGLTPDQVCYIGDDWNDLQSMEFVGVSMCPHDAAEEVKHACHYVSDKSGGHGAVRSCIEHLLSVRGEWSGATKRIYYCE